MKTIYLDHGATTPMKPEVIEAITKAFKETYGNPSSIHHMGLDAKEKLLEARQKVASLIGAEEREIYFTSGGTESDNWAIHIAKKTKPGKHIITSLIEHHAILHPLQELEKEGYRVTYLKPDEFGMIHPEQVREAITDDTILVTLMFVNNEIGTINPIKEIAAICKEKGVLFHTDGVQAVGNIPVDVNDLGVDMMSMSSHKIYGPKGIGALYIRKGLKVVPFIHGGAQERRVRAGTENLPGIIGFAKAAELAKENLPTHVERLTALREKLVKGILERIPETKYNGHPTLRQPGNVNVCFKYVEGESILLLLDMHGICGSSGSACTSGSLDPSHVLMGIGLTHDIAHGSLRLSLGDGTTEEEIDYVLDVLPKIIERLRQMSPLTE
ncbi:cysteine desulfurase NifS [Guggenheimella bovis]